MKIVQVEYRRLKSFGNYENEMVGAVADLEEGQTPEQALEEVQSWVAARLQLEIDDDGMRRKVWQSERRLAELNGLIKSAGERFEYAKKILAAHGIDVPTDHHAFEDDPELESLPF
jgi:hypothetical protein